VKKILLTLILIFSTALCIFAQQSFQLQFPVKCTINKDCWVLNYVDDDSTSNWHDYKNGRQTYDGHTGVDIAIKNITKMKQGVDVVAAEGGFVITTRDGVPDKNALAQDIDQLQNIGCGNRVAIKHSGGWITDYCHMKNGSIKVKKGDFVSAGQAIGQIGMSGLTEFPHMHMNLQQNNQFFDPFTGLERYTKGVKNPLWSSETLQKLVYKPLVVYNVGVSDEIPTFLNIRQEKYKNNSLSFFSNMMIIWVDMFHVETGDTIDILVKTKSGTPFIKQHIVIDKSNAKKLLYVGKKKPTNGFAKGTYNVQISFKRPKANIDDNRLFDFVVY
jgi:hypothetical protein